MSCTEDRSRDGQRTDHEVELVTTSEGALLCNRQRPSEWFQSTLS
jgi:hypothetical protein